MKLPQPNEIRKPSKTLAGVTPIAVMCKPRKCKHGTCLYCPSLEVPQSYTPKSPPVLRASRMRYDSFEQVKSRLKAFDLMNHPTSKIELIIMGGNFLDYPLKYQKEFVKKCYDALNNKKSNGKKKSKTLEEAKKRNQKAKHRCVALCIEARPDTILDKGVIKRLLEFGCTRVELGVQCLDDKIYKKVNRGHGVKEVVDASELLKDNGFKVGYHMMLGLPGSNKKKDLQMFKMLFKDDRFKPDQLKIYPCQVIQGSELVSLYKRGGYSPYSQKELMSIIVEIMKLIPNYCRVMRVMREIPPDYLIAGIKRIDLRKDIEDKLKNDKSDVKEIRFREIGFVLRDLKKGKKINNKLNLKITKYNAEEGNEYFLEIINKNNILFGLCRLRIFNRKKEKLAFIRELHVYGQALEIGKKGKSFGQHLGLGKSLIKECEKIVKEREVKELKIISGVGVESIIKNVDIN